MGYISLAANGFLQEEHKVRQENLQYLKQVINPLAYLVLQILVDWISLLKPEKLWESYRRRIVFMMKQERQRQPQDKM